MLWWSGRQIANVTPAKDGGVRVHLDAGKMWETKDVRAASIAQGKRYAERWCAARGLEGVPLKEAVARLVAQDRPPKLSRTEMQQQRRLDAIPNPRL